MGHLLNTEIEEGIGQMKSGKIWLGEIIQAAGQNVLRR